MSSEDERQAIPDSGTRNIMDILACAGVMESLVQRVCQLVEQEEMMSDRASLTSQQENELLFDDDDDDDEGCEDMLLSEDELLDAEPVNPNSSTNKQNSDDSLCESNVRIVRTPLPSPAAKESQTAAQSITEARQIDSVHESNDANADPVIIQVLKELLDKIEANVDDEKHIQKVPESLKLSLHNHHDRTQHKRSSSGHLINRLNELTNEKVEISAVNSIAITQVGER